MGNPFIGKQYEIVSGTPGDNPRQVHKKHNAGNKPRQPASFPNPTKGGSMTDRQEIIVTDIRMSFVSMVVFMIKWVIAAIPALLILSVLFGLASMLFAGFMGGMMGGHMGPYH
jgi:hypothetical protein